MAIFDSDRLHDFRAVTEREGNMDIGTAVQVDFKGEIISKYKKGELVFFQVRYCIEPGIFMYADVTEEYLTDLEAMAEKIQADFNKHKEEPNAGFIQD